MNVGFKQRRLQKEVLTLSFWQCFHDNKTDAKRHQTAVCLTVFQVIVFFVQSSSTVLLHSRLWRVYMDHVSWDLKSCWASVLLAAAHQCVCTHREFLLFVFVETLKLHTENLLLHWTINSEYLVTLKVQCAGLSGT